MATYRVESPTGEVYEIEAPDDATEAQVMDRARQGAEVYAQNARTGEALQNRPDVQRTREQFGIPPGYQVGVMADENPDLVRTDPVTGLGQVDYSKVDLDVVPESRPELTKQQIQAQMLQRKHSVAEGLKRGALDVGQGIKQGMLQAAEQPSPYTARALAANRRAGVDPNSSPSAADYTQDVNQEVAAYEQARGPDAGFDWARLGGNVAATAPLMAIPGGAATIPARIGMGALQGAAAGGAQFTPNGTGAERLTNMAVGAAAGGAVPVLGQALRKTLSGMKPATQAAAEFVKRGIPLTAGQMGGGITRAAEKFAENVPFVGPAIQARQREALSAWNRSLLQQIDASVKQGGKEGFEQAGKTLSAAYKQVWKDTIPFNRAGLRDAWDQLSGEISKELPKEQADEVVKNLLGQFKHIRSGARGAEGTQGSALELVDDALRDLAKRANKAGDGALAGAYTQARTAFRSQLDPVTDQALKHTDALYMQLSVLRNAAKRSGWETFTPAQLLMASKRRASDAAVAEMRAPFQQEALKAADVLGSPRSGAEAALERGVSQVLGRTAGAAALGGGAIADLGTTATLTGLGRLAYTKAGQRLLAGQTGPQRAGYEFLFGDEQLAKQRAIAALLRGGAASAATQPEVKE